MPIVKVLVRKSFCPFVKSISMNIIGLGRSKPMEDRIFIIINFIFSLISFHSFDIIDISMKFINILFIGATLLIILGSIVISIKIGQGGSRLKFDNEDKYEEKNRDDDGLWKLGNTIYYNPEDPALFIEKRFGVGWTVNAGKPLGMFFMILPFIIIVVTLLMTIER